MCKTHSNYTIGQTASISKQIMEDDLKCFAHITGDFNPIHFDEEYARNTRFKGRIAHGMISAGLVSTVLGTKLPGYGAIYLGQTLRFINPVRIGDVITAEVRVIEWQPEKSKIKLDTRCINQDGTEVLAGEAVLLVGG